MNEYEGSESVNTNIVKAVLSYVMSFILMYLCTNTSINIHHVCILFICIILVIGRSDIYIYKK